MLTNFRGAGLAAMMLLATSAWAKSNFSGTWKMDPVQSQFGQLPKPASMLRVIKHTDPVMEVDTTQSGAQGEVKSQMRYNTNGKESSNTLRGAEIKSICQWEGEALVIRYMRQIGPDTSVSVTEQWSLSADGKTTTIDTQMAGGGMNTQFKVVLLKQ
jgi:hypothetical protein